MCSNNNFCRDLITIANVYSFRVLCRIANVFKHVLLWRFAQDIKCKQNTIFSNNCSAYQMQ